MDSDPLAPGVTLASANHLDSRDECSGRSFRRGWDGWVVPGLYRSILATVLPAFNTVDLDVEGASSAILPRFRRKEEFRVRLGGAPLPDVFSMTGVPVRAVVADVARNSAAMPVSRARVIVTSDLSLAVFARRILCWQDEAISHTVALTWLLRNRHCSLERSATVCSTARTNPSGIRWACAGPSSD
jgi:hypothetical protein